MKKIFIICVIIFFPFFLSCSNEKAGNEIVGLEPYPEEAQTVIGRGLIAFSKDKNSVFLTWRFLPNDPEGITFELHRKEIGKDDSVFQLICQTDRTSYIDSHVVEGQRYYYTVRPISGGKQGPFSREAAVTVTEKGQDALIFDVGQNYKQARVATGDLDGDGELEVIIAYANNWDVDPNKKWWKKSEDTIKIAAFRYTGERLWTIDLGWGIEAGGNYSPIVVWDIDADGRAEVILKTNKSGDPLDYESERLAILDGKTGKIENEAKWPSVKDLGEYNSNSRNYIAIAHLDGKNPYIIAARGLYNPQKIWAYDKTLNRVWERIIGRDLNSIKKIWHYDEKIKRIWARLTNDETRGSHCLPIADIDGDGKEEVMWGEHCIGENGKDLWVIERTPYKGQPDVVFVADILPSNEGKEIYYCREGWYSEENENIGMILADKEGKIIWAHWGFTHVDGGWAARIIPDQRGMQCYAFDVLNKKIDEKGAKYDMISHYLYSSEGKPISNPNWYRSFPVDWDGDGVREICLRSGDVQRYDGTILAKLDSRPLWGADLFGDYREEIVVTPGNREIYIFLNTEVMDSPPKITRLADRQYKNDLSRTAMQYNVIPTEGGYIPKKH